LQEEGIYGDKVGNSRYRKCPGIADPDGDDLFAED